MRPVPQKTKATRKRLTISQKLEIPDLLDNGHRTVAAMRQFGIADRTVRKIKAAAPELLRVANDKPNSLQMKTFQSVMVTHLELNLLEFLNYARSARMLVTQAVLQKRAIMIREKMLKAPVTEKERSVLQKFTASRGCVEKFVRRHALRSVALHLRSAKARLPYGESQQTTNTEQTDVHYRVHADRWDDVNY